MIDDDFYVNKLYELSRIIYDKPIIEKPTLGHIPNFEDSSLDPILDIAKSLLNEEKLNLELNQIISSNLGSEIFRNEIDLLNTQLKEKVELYKNSTGLHFHYESDGRDSTLIQCEEFCVSFYWDLKYSNTAENASLIVRQWKGYLRLDNRAFYFPSEEPKKLKEIKYKFDLNYSKEVIWGSLKEKALTTEIIQDTFVFLINEVKKVKSKNFRK
ncbi:hypothetical protein [Flavobacterium sp. 83]|uniref:hypothetical protein n=1 Tax=Flavobacterium sp. 83 TaxID=1131812 RepID=UPI000552799E|nr:hypothetical protein [Flavobacterium sp. 83]